MLLYELGSQYIHISVNYGKAQIIGKLIVIFLSYIDNNIDVTKYVAIKCDGTSINTDLKRGANNEINPEALTAVVCLPVERQKKPLRNCTRRWKPRLGSEASPEK